MAKRYGNLFHKITDMANLTKAHRKARKGKRHYKAVKEFEKDMWPYKYINIQNMLVNETYEVSEYTISKINDNGKEREIYKLPYYPDRIIQWAIMLQLEPIFMKIFTSFSCASVKGRGIHYASKLLTRYMDKDKEGTKYCLKIDIKKFYPNINHNILKALLRKKFKDNKLLRLLDKIIDSIPNEKGIPIGSYLSQYLANYYLTFFDHWLKEELKIPYVIRYMDDIVILSNSKEHLHKVKRQLDSYLYENLKLEIKSNWQVFPTDKRGVDFVGYRHFHKYKLLRKTSCKKFKKKALKIKYKYYNEIPLTLHDILSFNSYLGLLKWCDSLNLLKKYWYPIQVYLDRYQYNHQIILKN